MRIPDYFLRKAARQFGDDGPEWVQALPSMLAQCQEQWQLTDCVPLDNLSINLVCYAHSAKYGDVILKIAGPHSEQFTEMMALQIYAGKRACACLESDKTLAAMLLERITPGHDLRALPSKRTQLEIGAELIANLPVPLSENPGFPSYGDWIDRAIATTYAKYNPNARLIALMTAMGERFREICPADVPQALLHGDLHHENMLQHSDGTWKIIDPQGVIGAPFLESGRFIENHVIDHNGVIHLELLDETVAYFAERLNTTKHVINSAFFILHLLSTLWGLQMNYDNASIMRLIDECEMLLGRI